MEIIKVEQGEYRKARSPDVLDSGGIGPCIVVGAIYGKKGYMSHEVSSLIDLRLDEMLRDLKKECRELRKLEIYIAGGGTDSREDTYINDGILDERVKILELIAEAGLSRAIKEIRWNKDRHNQTLVLLLSEHRAEYKMDSDEDLEDEDFEE